MHLLIVLAAVLQQPAPHDFFGVETPYPPLAVPLPPAVRGLPDVDDLDRRQARVDAQAAANEIERVRLQALDQQVQQEWRDVRAAATKAVRKASPTRRTTLVSDVTTDAEDAAIKRTYGIPDSAVFTGIDAQGRRSYAGSQPPLPGAVVKSRTGSILELQPIADRRIVGTVQAAPPAFAAMPSVQPLQVYAQPVQAYSAGVYRQARPRAVGQFRFFGAGQANCASGRCN